MNIFIILLILIKSQGETFRWRLGTPPASKARDSPKNCQFQVDSNNLPGSHSCPDLHRDKLQQESSVFLIPWIAVFTGMTILRPSFPTSSSAPPQSEGRMHERSADHFANSASLKVHTQSLLSRWRRGLGWMQKAG